MNWKYQIGGREKSTWPHIHAWTIIEIVYIKIWMIRLIRNFIQNICLTILLINLTLNIITLAKITSIWIIINYLNLNFVQIDFWQQRTTWHIVGWTAQKIVKVVAGCSGDNPRDAWKRREFLTWENWPITSRQPTDESILFRVVKLIRFRCLNESVSFLNSVVLGDSEHIPYCCY